jgi:hypothetical protein
VQKLYEKMHNIINHQENGNQNYSKVIARLIENAITKNQKITRLMELKGIILSEIITACRT